MTERVPSRTATVAPPPDAWPQDLPVVQVRLARPTARLAEVVAFYRDGLGLAQVAAFQDHAGYSGVMLGLPGLTYHLEFTSHTAGSDGAAPTRDNLLVLYLPDRGAIDCVVERLAGLGHRPVDPENPYWAERGITIEDPDGWRVVLMASHGLGT